jgi:hypothetical protein
MKKDHDEGAIKQLYCLAYSIHKDYVEVRMLPGAEVLKLRQMEREKCLNKADPTTAPFVHPCS